MLQKASLPSTTQRSLDTFITSAQHAFGDDLLSATLFGTAAEGALRSTSDVNLILVLKKFDKVAVDKISEPLRLAHASILLEVMFILENEIDAASDAFAVKFSDIATRHKVILGKDYFAHLEITPEALRQKLKQVLIGQILRLRERYVLVNRREEQLIKVIADTAGPLRSAAAALLNLQGRTTENPKEALNTFIRENLIDPKWGDVLATISQAREGLAPSQKDLHGIYFLILELAEHMLENVEKMSI